MAKHEYYGQDAAITVDTADGGTTDVVAGLRQVTVRELVDVDEGRSADSVKRSSERQRNYRVRVDAAYINWDVEFLREWHGGSGGTANSAMQDTTQPKLFDIQVDVTQHDAATDLRADVTDAYTDDIPVFNQAAFDGGVVENDVTFVGKDLSLSEV